MKTTAEQRNIEARLWTDETRVKLFVRCVSRYIWRKGNTVVQKRNINSKIWWWQRDGLLPRTWRTCCGEWKIYLMIWTFKCDKHTKNRKLGSRQVQTSDPRSSKKIPQMSDMELLGQAEVLTVSSSPETFSWKRPSWWAALSIGFKNWSAVKTTFALIAFHVQIKVFQYI